MFHVKLSGRDLDRLAAVLDWIEVERTSELTEALTGYAGWLVDEGIKLGGLGPNEAERVWDRHVIDSLVFGYDAASTATILDIGSGVGLPGIPLAVALPHAEVTLLDRAGRRIDALRRVAAVFSLDVTLVHGDVAAARSEYDRAVLRASLTVDAALGIVPPLLKPGGEMWFGLGRGDRPDAVTRWLESPVPSPPGAETALLRTPPAILDSTSWMLRMQVP